MKAARQRLQRLNDDLQSGRLTPDEWADKFDAELLSGHREAIRLGILRAGGDLPSDDELFVRAREAKDLESEYLQGFLDAVKGGDERYVDEAGNIIPGSLDARSSLYVGKMRGSANQAFMDASPDDARWTWRLGPERHCADCPRYAALIKSVPRDEVIAVPGEGETECLGNCNCDLVRDDGVEGFPRGHLSDDEDQADSSPDEGG